MNKEMATEILLTRDLDLPAIFYADKQRSRVFCEYLDLLYLKSGEVVVGNRIFNDIFEGNRVGFNTVHFELTSEKS